MKLDKRYLIEKAVSKYDTRPCLQGVYLERKDETHGTLIATDGKILAKIPVAITKDDKVGIIPIELIKKARVVGPETVVAPSEPTDGMVFPNYQRIIPKTKVQFTIIIDPQRLLDLAKAIGAEKRSGVKLEFRSPSDPITVTNAKGFGLLMPMKGDTQ